MDKNITLKLKQWIIKADNDLKTASQSFKFDEIITDTICFHCQQSVEKYLKLFLVYNGVFPKKTHKIEILINLCLEFDSSFAEIKKSAILTEYAVV